MATIKVIAGDFKEGKESQWLGGYDNNFYMKIEGQFLREKISVTAIEEIEIASEENVKRIGGTIGWGVAGSVLLGGVGLLAGLIAGGKGKDITFVCKFKDGRKLLGVISSKAYSEIQARLFDLENGTFKQKSKWKTWHKVFLSVVGIPLVILFLLVIFVKPH